MAYEVEIKAHAYPELKEVLDRFCSAEGHAVDKDDIYFAFPTDTSPKFRIRTCGDELLITAKRNHRENGLECNEELEFSHSAKDKDVMIKMAHMLGYVEFLRKQKKGYEWHYKDVHIELLNVKTLGWFLEMEIMSDTNDKEKNRDKILLLYSILNNVGLCSCDVESKSYQQMLKEQKEK